MPSWFFSALVALVVVAGCASEVKRQAVEMSITVPERGQHYVTAEAVAFRLESGYSRSVSAETEFVVAGRIAQGLVLRPTQTVLTVEGAHMHEAYAVLNDGQLVGFYLPVERAFSALPLATSFPLVERK